MNAFVQELIEKNQDVKANSSILNVVRHPTKTTEKYTPVDDIAILELLNSKGWNLTKYKQVKAHKTEENQYKLYLAQFENPSFPSSKDANFQLLQYNAKDGTRSYQFMVGFISAATLKSFIVQNQVFKPLRIRHVGVTPTQVSEVLDKILDLAPVLYDRITQMKGRNMSEAEMNQFARAAIEIRLGEDNKDAMKVDEILTRRRDVVTNNLWEVLNTVHENLIYCPDGVTKVTKKNKIRKARAVTNIQETIRINTQLWNLAETFLA